MRYSSLIFSTSILVNLCAPLSFRWALSLKKWDIFYSNSYF
ncbi:hypothetical protein GGR14_002101 [Butyricimonas faecihominis]|uniref:Uncharacterized protein n=1 Tax=Butyricimonas faecihominis TaxID=1472416 RepID=A0A7W6HWL7_9BACT|nr:hypothetical protein [Butyricimonas faecihominis]